MPITLSTVLSKLLGECAVMGVRDTSYSGECAVMYMGVRDIR
jgi:hypothetical protein